jgi:hypothetical protein
MEGKTMARGDVLISERMIRKCFEGPFLIAGIAVPPDSAFPFERLWRKVFPQWDRIDHIDGWPTVSDKTNKYIFEHFIRFDRAYHPDTFPGGMWLNAGWRSDSNFKDDWVVDTTTCTVHYKEGLG